MRVELQHTTGELLRDIGSRLRAYRLQQNIAVDRLAADASLGVATVLRAETGRGMTVTTLLKLLRALGRLDAVDAFLPEAPISPLQLVKLRGRERRKASSPRAR